MQFKNFLVGGFLGGIFVSMVYAKVVHVWGIKWGEAAWDSVTGQRQTQTEEVLLRRRKGLDQVGRMNAMWILLWKQQQLFITTNNVNVTNNAVSIRLLLHIILCVVAVHCRPEWVEQWESRGEWNWLKRKPFFWCSVSSVRRASSSQDEEEIHLLFLLNMYDYKCIIRYHWPLEWRARVRC